MELDFGDVMWYLCRANGKRIIMWKRMKRCIYKEKEEHSGEAALPSP